MFWNYWMFWIFFYFLDKLVFLHKGNVLVGGIVGDKVCGDLQDLVGQGYGVEDLFHESTLHQLWLTFSQSEPVYSLTQNPCL